MKKLMPLIIFFFVTLISCEKKPIEVKVSNDAGMELGWRTVELPAQEILKRLDSKGYYITNESGEEIASQLTYDSLIIFNCKIGVGETKNFQIHRSDSVHAYPSKVWGQVYTKRRDDLSYENELVGFRIYGPATRLAGERAYGYDIFFKHPTEELIVPQLYTLQTDDKLWEKADSLRKIDNNLAEEFISSFTYHIDHGKGMDCYAVGATLGAGVAAILENDSIVYPWCYQTADILNNGPLRFTVHLKFPSTVLSPESDIFENRIISLDSYSYLNNCHVWYEGLQSDVNVVAGFPLRDDSMPIINIKEGILAYADPTQGENNGKALLGIKSVSNPISSIEKDNHVLLKYQLSQRDTLFYKWGFSWDKTEISSMEEWMNYLEKADFKYKVNIQ